MAAKFELKPTATGEFLFTLKASVKLFSPANATRPNKPR